MSNYYNEVINTVIDEMIFVIDKLRSGNCIAAYATYLDWKGDVKTLNSKDYNAACELFWYSVEDAGFELYSENDLRHHAGFQLAW